MTEKAAKLTNENDELKKRCENLLNELQEAFKKKRETQQKLDDVQLDCSDLLSQNHELQDYIEKLGVPDDLQNTGKRIPEVGEKHRRRKLKDLKLNVEKTLWFRRAMVSLSIVLLFQRKVEIPMNCLFRIINKKKVLMNFLKMKKRR